jgi:molybdopterin-guanine dinucleotide biosynthesis protein A
MPDVSIQAVCGIFVGGQARRMRGAAKGLLPRAPGGPSLVQAQIHSFRTACPQGEVVLVGEHSAYAGLGLRQLADHQLPDQTAGKGPLAGLVALCHYAQTRAACVLALACDMPNVNAALLARLLSEAPTAAALAPRPGGRWEPLCARYAPAATLPAAQRLLASGNLALFRVLEAVAASELELSEAELELLVDWDSPEDLPQP